MLIAALVLSSSLGVLIAYSIAPTKTVTSPIATTTISQTLTQTEVVMSTTTALSTQTLTPTVPTPQIADVLTTTQTELDYLPCTSIYPNGTGVPNFVPSPPQMFARQDSTVLICVEYYYYNNSSMTLKSTASLLQVSYNGNVTPASVNFAVTASPTNLTLGGSSSQNEGALVVYRINTGNTSSGTYVVSLAAYLYASYSNPEIELCGGYTTLVVSNPTPNYAQGYGSYGYCDVPLTWQYPLDSHGLVDGYLTAKIVGISNSE